jgi:hypothetical protein
MMNDQVLLLKGIAGIGKFLPGQFGFWIKAAQSIKL